MSRHFADRLCSAITEKDASVCVGIDPVEESLPDELRPPPGASPNERLDAVREFSRSVINVVGPVVPAVKINVAYFEPFAGPGLDCYFDLVAHARSLGLLVIGDVKRSDVGHSARQYASAHLESAGPNVAGSDPNITGVDPSKAGANADRRACDRPDAITVNPYLGLDGVKPFADVARRRGQGLFVLVQTSNPSTIDFQQLSLASASNRSETPGAPVPKTVAEAVACKVASWADQPGLVGESGFSLIGAVVAPYGASGVGRLRALMPRSVFLVPGFGAQGRGPADVANCFNERGGGALIAASRSIIYAFKNPRFSESGATGWTGCVERACREFAHSIADVQRHRS